ncbi:MAG: S8 family serine peptidase, partial [Acidimicrobiia bacterium]|nr:S8 family serine peptidase [Acidimicrobiia bacterium]
ERSDVASITPDDIDVIPTAGTPEPNLTAVNAPALWNLGHTGQGVVVASLDSGVDLNHPDLINRYRGGSNSWFDPYNQHPASPIDLTGHGTGTMGVMVGGDTGGTSIGMAPSAQWIAARIFDDRGRSKATAIHAAFQWLLDPDGNPNSADAPNVVNNSWSYGYGGGCNLAFQLDVQALRAVGIVPVFAAGNFGPGGSTSVSPANYPEALAVGGVNNSDSIYAYSSRGPSACGEASTVYPEIVAPGVNIRTAERYGMYQTASGTSLAAPHVAGALALLLSSNPNLTAAEQEAALLGSAVDLGAAGPDDQFGYGRLDTLAAYQWLQDPPPTTTTTTSSTTTTSTSTTTTSTTTTTAPTTTTTSTTTTTLPGTPFSDGFETGDLSAWSQAVTNGGNLSVTTAAGLVGTYGMQAVISGTSSMYVADQSPVASVSYGARFAFDPNGTAVPNRKRHDLLIGLDGGGTGVFRLQLQSSSGSYQVRGLALDYRGKEQATSWYTISDAPHTIEVTWRAASSSNGSDGEIGLVVDGAAAATKSGIRNGSHSIEEARLGPQGIGTGIAGTEFFDEFVSVTAG